ncbi:MAG: MG(2+) CHELATASE FAMILY PROTEIN / ComM-related protein [Microgenomates bacterium 39_7]|nr:MAG: MG(2+) CHELATASE FAMILY PROTEIN / ComM-related protein [Microgenomates bacterium 39_7]
MYASSHSVIFYKLQDTKVTVQILSQQGVPKIVISGMASKVINESKDRIVSCLKSLNIKPKSCRTVINLMPTDIIKKDNHLELALITAILASYELITINHDDCFIGAIGLKGEVQPVSKVLALVLAAKKCGCKRVFVSFSDLEKLRIINEIKVVGLKNVSQLLSNNFKCQQHKAAQYSIKPDNKMLSVERISGNKAAIRALQIAAVGYHHIFLIGPPGYGKTLLAHSLQSLLPPLSYDQVLKVAKIYSLAGDRDRVSSTPPFHQIELNTSPSAFLGNREREIVGEAQLADGGILFLDELNRFSGDILEILTRKLDTNFTQELMFEIPPFLLIAATNPCPCGFYGTDIRTCSCSLWQRQRYQQKISGALLDRFDLFLNVDQSIMTDSGFTTSEKINVDSLSEQVLTARQLLQQKIQDIKKANITGLKLMDDRLLSNKCMKILNKAKNNLKLSNRVIFKTIRVAQSIAFLDGESEILEQHLLEALSYRRKI